MEKIHIDKTNVKIENLPIGNKNQMIENIEVNNPIINIPTLVNILRLNPNISNDGTFDE